MYFEEKMLRKQIVLEKEIVRVVGRDQSVAWYACVGEGEICQAQWIESTEKCMLNIYH